MTASRGKQMRSPEGQAAILAGHLARLARIDADMLTAVGRSGLTQVSILAERSGYSKSCVRASLARLAAAGRLTVAGKRGTGTTITLTNRAASVPPRGAPAGPVAADGGAGLSRGEG